MVYENTLKRVGVTRNIVRMPGKQEAFSEEENRVLRAALRKLQAEQKLSQDAVGQILGIKQQNAGRLVRAGSTVGFGRGTANNFVRHLGYRDVEHFLLEHDALAALTEPPPQHQWSNRELAIRLAMHLKFDSAAVEAVVRRFTSNDAMTRPPKWWIHKFDIEEREIAADTAAASGAAAAVAASSSPPPPAAKTRKRAG